MWSHLIQDEFNYDRTKGYIVTCCMVSSEFIVGMKADSWTHDHEILHEKRQKGEAPEEKRGMPGVTFMACGVRQHPPGLCRELLLEVSLMEHETVSSRSI